MLCKGGILVFSRHFDWLNEIFLVLLWWVDPSQQPSTHTAAHSFFPSPQWDRRENRNNKGKKTCGSKQKQFNRWRKKMWCQVTQRQITHQLPQEDWCQISGFLWTISPSLPSTSALTAEHSTIWYRPSLWSLQVSCPLCPLPASCPCPAHLLGDRAGKSTLMLCKQDLAAAKTLLCYQHSFSHKVKKAAITEYTNSNKVTLNISETQYSSNGEPMYS